MRLDQQFFCHQKKERRTPEGEQPRQCMHRGIGQKGATEDGADARLKSGAKVTDFLGVFASRRARDALLRIPA
jgi:hypothetical protein